MKKYHIPPALSIAAESTATYYSIHRMSREGLGKSKLAEISERYNLSILKLSEILPASYSTLIKKDAFDISLSEHILTLEALLAYGNEVFGGVEKFILWLQTPNIVLGKSTPFSLLETHAGMAIVRNTLGRIDHGVFA